MRKKYKTKFPVARIKRIMQMDEDVGKMSQATPVLISKALELFMQSIVEDVSRQAYACNSRRISPTHLKRCIDMVECYDFLKDIVENVQDDGDGGGPEECRQKLETYESPVDAVVSSADAAHPGSRGGGSSGSVIPISKLLNASTPTSFDSGGSQQFSLSQDEPQSLSPSSTSSSSARGRGGKTRSRGRGRGRGRGGGQAKAAVA